MDIVNRVAAFVQEATWMIIAALMLLAAGRCVLQTASKLRRGRRLRDWLFEPVDPARLRKATAEYFDRVGLQMEELGFEHLGDYRLSRVPNSLDARFLIADDGVSFGSVSDCSGSRSYDFFSIFDDGTYLETTGTTCLYNPPTGDRFELYNHPDVAVHELYEKHQEHVRNCERRRGCSVVEVTPEDLDAVANYGRNVLKPRRPWRSRPTPPPPCVRGELAATSTH